MIKINLLPPRKKKAVVAGQRHLLFIILVLLVESLGFAFIYQQRSQTLQKKQDNNTGIQTEVRRLKKEIGDLDKLKKERKELEKQQAILDSLERARSGPVKVLDEVAFLLTQAITENAQFELQMRGLNTTWDPRRISLGNFKEADRKVQITGVAKTNDDVAEFMKRLESSIHFYNVQLSFTKTTSYRNIDIPVIAFDIRCRISYSGKKDEQPLFDPKATKRGKHG